METSTCNPLTPLYTLESNPPSETDVKSAFASGEAKLPLTTEAIAGEIERVHSSTRDITKHNWAAENLKASKDRKMGNYYNDPSMARHRTTQDSERNVTAVGVEDYSIGVQH